MRERRKDKKIEREREGERKDSNPRRLSNYQNEYECKCECDWEDSHYIKCHFHCVTFAVTLGYLLMISDSDKMTTGK